MFDYLTLRKMSHGSHRRHVAWTLTYCGVAGTVWFIWQAAPFASLCTFILIAMYHFSEDWNADKSRLGAGSMAISMITLPVLLYPAELSVFFVLIGGASGGQLVDYLLLIAPVFGLVAVAGVVIDFTSNNAVKGWRNGILLLAALILPPGAGFAVYFCLYHSPMHFSEGRRTLLDGKVHWDKFFLYMSIASAVVVLLVFIAQPFESMNARLIATTFQTLSILTVPHMLLSIFATRNEGPTEQQLLGQITAPF